MKRSIEPSTSPFWFVFSPGFRKLNFRVLSVGGVDDGGAADLGDAFAVAVEAPAADLVRADDVFDELEWGMSGSVSPRNADTEANHTLFVYKKLLIRKLQENLIFTHSLKQNIYHWKSIF